MTAVGLATFDGRGNAVAQQTVSRSGTFNSGTGTAVTRHAYKVTSDYPIVAYQFNPLDNEMVFSNDASQLLPFTGLNTGVGLAYVVPGWPQTIAKGVVPARGFWDRHVR